MCENNKLVIVAEKMKDSGDTPESCSTRFVSVLSDLFLFLKDINEFLKSMSSDGKHPVSPVVIDLAVGAITSLNKEKIMSMFSDRAIAVAPAIYKKDIDKFEGIAHSLFEGIPSSVIDTIINILKNKTVPSDSIDDTFGFIHSLMRISLKGKVYKVANGIEEPTPELIAAVDIFF